MNKICTIPRCGRRFKTSDQRRYHCDTHEPEHLHRDNTRRSTKKRDHGRDTAAWRTLRQQRLALDHEICQLRHPGCTEHATTVHLNPALEGQHARATLDDCTSACHHCHGVEDAPRASQARGGASRRDVPIPPVDRQFFAVGSMRGQEGEVAWIV